MTMMFRTVKDSLINNILGPAERGRYRTVGYQRQVRAASEVLNALRTVQAYFSQGEFPKTSGSVSGTVMHDCVFRLDLTVATAAEGDLSAVNDGATAEIRAAALAAFQEASAVADEDLDELFDIIYQVIMDSMNSDIGLPAGSVANRWIGTFRKDQPTPQGEYVILTGALSVECRVAEQILGDEGVINDVYDVTVDQDGDDVEKAGVAGTLGGGG